MNEDNSMRDTMKRLQRHYVLFFFFQAEDGIRDVAVTGVQTCALPISWQAAAGRFPRGSSTTTTTAISIFLLPATWSGTPNIVRLAAGVGGTNVLPPNFPPRSGEGRGGEEWRSRGAADH